MLTKKYLLFVKSAIFLLFMHLTLQMLRCYPSNNCLSYLFLCFLFSPPTLLSTVEEFTSSATLRFPHPLLSLCALFLSLNNEDLFVTLKKPAYNILRFFLKSLCLYLTARPKGLKRKSCNLVARPDHKTKLKSNETCLEENPPRIRFYRRGNGNLNPPLLSTTTPKKK